MFTRRERGCAPQWWCEVEYWMTKFNTITGSGPGSVRNPNDAPVFLEDVERRLRKNLQRSPHWLRGHRELLWINVERMFQEPGRPDIRWLSTAEIAYTAYRTLKTRRLAGAPDAEPTSPSEPLPRTVPLPFDVWADAALVCLQYFRAQYQDSKLSYLAMPPGELAILGKRESLVHEAAIGVGMYLDDLRLAEQALDRAAPIESDPEATVVSGHVGMHERRGRMTLAREYVLSKRDGTLS